MASSQMIVSLTVADFENIVQRAVLSALSGKSVPSSSAPSTKKVKKEKKEKDPNAPKKEPNEWIVFTQKVREALKGAGIKAGVEVTQFCGMLKSKNADYASWSSDAILVEHSGWKRPEVSKQALAKSAEVSPTSATDAPAKKARKPQSEETKKAAAEKRAATKAAKSAASAPLPASPAPKAKAPAPAPAAEAEEEDNITDFAPWTFKKAPYLKNKRGDVLSEEYDWIGRFDEKAGKIDRAFPKPADLEEE